MELPRQRVRAIAMSALGQKQTFALQTGMSALHPKADIPSADCNVRFVLTADMKCPMLLLLRSSAASR